MPARAHPSAPRRAPVLRRAAGVAVASCLLGVSAPAAFAAAGDSPTVVRSGSLGVWADYLENTATTSFVDGPGTPPLGSGSLHFLTGSGTGSGKGGKNYTGSNTLSGTALGDISALSYDTWVDHLQSRLAPDLNLNVDLDGTGGRDTTLVFEPVYQTQQPVAQVWQHWDVATGNLRSTKAVQGLSTDGAPYTLAGLAASYPNAKVVPYYARPDGAALVLGAGQSSGEIWAGFDGNVDNVRVARTGASPSDVTYDFEGGSAPCSTDCYVDAANGDDGQSGRSPAEAKKTIQAGIDAVDAGGTVHLLAGTYLDQGVIGKSLTLDGDTAANTVISGASGDAAAGTRTGLTITAAGVVVRDVTVSGERRGIQLTGDDADGAVLTHLVASGNVEQGIISENFTLDGLTVDDVVASDNHGTTANNSRGLWLVNGDKSGITVTNSTFANNGLVGLDVSDGTVTGAHLSGNTVTGNGDAGIGVLGALGSDNTVSGNTVTDNGRFGIEVKNSTGAVTVAGNTVSRTTAATSPKDLAGIAVIQRGGAQPLGATVSGNTVTGFARMGGGTGDGFGIVVEGTGHAVTGNTLTGDDVGVQVQGGNPTANTQGTDYFDRGNAATGGASVTGNRLTGNGVGVRVVGGSTAPAAGSTASDGVSITGNVIRNGKRGVDVPGQAATGSTSVRFNAIVGNSETDGASGLRNGSGTPVDAVHDWWGCNAGPGASGCDTVTGATYAPWLVLSATLGDKTLDKGQSTPLTGDLRTDSAGQPAVGNYPDGGVVAFSGGALATVSPATDALSGQSAATTLTAGTTTGGATATAAYDNATAPAPYVVQDALTASVNDVRKAEGNPTGTTAFTFTVTLNRASDQPERVAYRTVEGTAKAPSDYTGKVGTLTFAPGQTSQTVTVNVVRDRTTEADETFSLQLVAGSSTPAIARGTGTGTIVNDDAKPVITVGDVGIDEGNSGTKAMLFPVRLDRPSSTAVTVRYTTAVGTAKSPSDFLAASGTVTFAPGTTLVQVAIQVVGDRVKEPSETFVLNVFSPTGATIGDPNGSGVIRNDD